MEAKVPQRIDMEDKVIGPLTLVQFFYLLFGGLFIYLLNAWTRDSAILHLLFYPVAFIIGIVSIMLAFVKIQDRPFVFFLLAMIEFIRRPRTRYWAKGAHVHQAKIVPNNKPAAKAVPRKEFDRARVSDLAKVVDTSVSSQEGPGQL